VTNVFEFHELDAMPCGCVAAAYRSWHWGVMMVSLEAKGPHCVLPGHEEGKVLEMNDLFDEGAEDEALGSDAGPMAFSTSR
jgi:hypothetical protein